MRIVIAVTSQDDFLRTTVSVMDADIDAEECRLLHGLQHERHPSQKYPHEEAFEVVAELPADQSNRKLSMASFSPRKWLTPSLIHWVVQLLSVIAFCALLLHYLRYTRAKKAALSETCKRDAWFLYESNLAQCDINAATGFRFRGGALGLNWIEYGTILLAAIAWHYVAWLFQGWVIVRICFVETGSER
ncbi:hypothetical protein AYL99_00769 [Fonsecaea erecta]|uniref:Uncharacterized protein n=1 Tax=Fonsecaea erecta TaxID=1367422 RepID=A0A178ZYI6_9EURO|nr:hypothetical protein AYL99_00769 [Fonsecaea erecta]OAP64797.1 hypothetical protein AYL99_00769 [Fonsecaea erecta]